MKHEIEHYLQDSIDEAVHLRPYKGSLTIPAYLLELYDFYESEVLDTTCVFAELVQDSLNVDILQKHLKVMKHIFSKHVVMMYRSITRYRRKSLLKYRIPFIVADQQMYLPFLNLELKESRTIEDPSIRVERRIMYFPPATQLTYLLFLYDKKLSVNATDLAEMIETSIMTASRVLNELYAVELLHYELAGKTGRSKLYTRVEDPGYYRKGRWYMRDPVLKKVYIDHEIPDTCIAGMQVLEKTSMISDSGHRIRAIAKKEFRKQQPELVRHTDIIADENLIELEIWQYDPRLLTDTQYVDISSLKESLKELNDERVDSAIADRMREEPWYTD